MDRRTRNQIQRMDSPERREYTDTITLDLRRAEAKHERLAGDIQRTQEPKQLEAKQRKLRRIERQVTTLREILEFIDRHWPPLNDPPRQPPLA